MITLHTGHFHPPFAQGLVRDMRVRWALEEAGLPYRVVTFDRQRLAEPDYRKLHPFGQIPYIEDGDLNLFDSSAIILYIAEQTEALLPRERDRRARAIAWVCTSISSIEHAVDHICRIDLFAKRPEAEAQIRPDAEALVERRLAELDAWLTGRDYLEHEFSAGDLIMSSTLELMRHTDLVSRYSQVLEYMERCRSRPAYIRALRDHMAVYAQAGREEVV